MKRLLPDKIFYTIQEVSNYLGIKPYVLRFWESEFEILRPARTRGAQRRYRKEDIEIIERIRELLYSQKYTIKGAREKLALSKQKDREELKFELEREIVELLEMLQK
jgi:DNA-binding transcriptional MerR regulator